MTTPVVDIFLIYMFLQRLVTPFDKTKAFKLGLIDAEGKRLKKAKTSEEKLAMGYFDRLVFNLKRLLGTIPGGQTVIGSFAAALLLLREEDERLAEDEEFLAEEFREEIRTLDLDLCYQIMEDASANSVAGGHVAGADGEVVSWKLGIKKPGRPKTYNQWKRAKGLGRRLV